MNKKMLGIYLNDHLAGSALGLEVLSAIAETPFANPDEVARVKREFDGERAILRALLEKLEIGESPIRKAGAWLNAKLLEVKVGIEDFGKGGFYSFELLEALSTGMAGKHLLWVALEKLAQENETIGFPPYALLIEQVLAQRAWVEGMRTEAARQAFGLNAA